MMKARGRTRQEMAWDRENNKTDKRRNQSFSSFPSPSPLLVDASDGRLKDPSSETLQTSLSWGEKGRGEREGKI